MKTLVSIPDTTALDLLPKQWVKVHNHKLTIRPVLRHSGLVAAHHKNFNGHLRYIFLAISLTKVFAKWLEQTLAIGRSVICNLATLISNWAVPQKPDYKREFQLQ